MWPGSGPLDYKGRWDNLAIVEVHCGACIVWDEANKVQSCCLILALWPRSRQDMLLLSLHLSPPLWPSELWQEGFQEQLWSVSACHSALVTPGERSPLWAQDGPGKGWRLNARNEHLCVTQQTWALVAVLRCVPHVSCLTPSMPCSYSFISPARPHHSIQESLVTPAHFSVI